MPLSIRQSLYKQEKFFKKIIREKTKNQINEENIKNHMVKKYQKKN